MELKEKVQKDYNEGLRSEDLFIKVAISAGYKCLKTSRSIDIDEHWDCLIKKDGKKAKVQVKGLKKSHEDGYTWIEIKRYDGRKGWLYGKADVLALQHPHRFDIYLMKSIRKLIKEKVDFTLPILKSKPKKENGDIDYEKMRFRQYNGWSRRDDISVIISFDDIKDFKLKTITIE